MSFRIHKATQNLYSNAQNAVRANLRHLELIFNVYWCNFIARTKTPIKRLKIGDMPHTWRYVKK